MSILIRSASTRQIRKTFRFRNGPYILFFFSFFNQKVFNNKKKINFYLFIYLFFLFFFFVIPRFPNRAYFFLLFLYNLNFSWIKSSSLINHKQMLPACIMYAIFYYTFLSYLILISYWNVNLICIHLFISDIDAWLYQ